ncbi:MAG: hypothetical protein HY552_05965 [Elusimicrobia bacterium]|nr:hypothetical protein [Elusimicrobiota bacterium]
MKKIVKSQVSFVVMREGIHFVAYAPALDMATSGRTYAEVERRSKELIQIFIEETLRHGTMDEALEGLGWKKIAKTISGHPPHWVPPQVVGQITQPMHIPVGVQA